jgi:predicted RNA binding protein YcfA (HicA-like mRNA interferase family)
MPKHLRNWTFDDVSEFLEQNSFVLAKVEGSHHYFVASVDGKDRLCHIQRHPQGSILPKTLRLNVIIKSGIPEELWLKWAESPSNKRKKIVYEGAKPRPLPADETVKEPSFIPIEVKE